MNPKLVHPSRPSPGARVAAATATGRPLPTEESRVLRSFLVDGRLVSIPARGRKREVVLRYLLDEVFPDDRERPEPAVNEALRRFHEDVAALRRYLVEARLVTRDRGIYRRVAPFEPPTEAARPAPD